MILWVLTGFCSVARDALTIFVCFCFDLFSADRADIACWSKGEQDETLEAQGREESGWEKRNAYRTIGRATESVQEGSLKMDEKGKWVCFFSAWKFHSTNNRLHWTLLSISYGGTKPTIHLLFILHYCICILIITGLLSVLLFDPTTTF